MSSTAIADEGYDDLEDDGGLSGFWILVIFLVVLSVFAAIVYFAYQRGLDDRGVGNDLAVISANPETAREEVSVGPTYDARAEEVYDELNDEADTSRIVADVDPAGDPLENYEETSPATDGEMTSAERIDARLANAGDSAAETSVPVPSVAPGRDTPSGGSSSSNNADTTPTPAATTPATTTPAASTPATTTGAAGTYAVQLGAFGSQDEAMGVYSRLSGSVGALISNYTPEVNVATVKGNTYHRLWIGEFASREEAASHCERITAAGQGCFIQRR